MSVVVAHEVRRCPVPSPNLDDLGRLVGRTGRPAVHAQPVTYYCTHDNSSQGSYPAACTFPRIGGRGRRHRRPRVRFLYAQLAELDPQLLELIRQHPAGPALLTEAGVGPVVAAQLLISWSHHGRVRNEAAFASLAGVSPLETSSGQRSRHRLNRGGDRALNRALHTVAITRMRCHPETRVYEARRIAEGKSHRDIRRSVKRALARRLYREIEAALEPTRQKGVMIRPALTEANGPTNFALEVADS